MDFSSKILHSNLKTKILQPEIIHFKSIDSTNKYLLGKYNHPNGTIVLADFQTAGRGRRQRTWESPKSESLLFSIFLNENIENIPLYSFTFLAAVGVYEGLLPFIPQKHLALKWPNDILINGKKVCGILVETKTSTNRLDTVVIGIGININQSRKFFQSNSNLKYGTSLFTSTGVKFSRNKILYSAISAIDRNLIVLENNNEKFILKKWKGYCPYISKQIAVYDGNKKYEGVFKDISHNGGIILKTASEMSMTNEEKIFHAADVTIVQENGNL